MGGRGGTDNEGVEGTIAEDLVHRGGRGGAHPPGYLTGAVDQRINTTHAKSSLASAAMFTACTRPIRPDPHSATRIFFIAMLFPAHASPMLYGHQLLGHLVGGEALLQCTPDEFSL